MHSVFLISSLALASYVVAGDMDANDVPSQCKDVCAPVVSLTASCDKKTSNDDTAEMSCICKDSGASKSVPHCAACLTQYGKDGSDNDANDLVQSCSFTTTTYTYTFPPSKTSGFSTNTTNGPDAIATSATSGTSFTTGSGGPTPTSTTNAASQFMKPGNGVFGTTFVGMLAALGI